MRKIALSVSYSLALLCFVGSAQTTEQNFYYSLDGSLDKAADVKKVCVSYEIIGEKKEDCVSVIDGKFNLRKELSQPASAMMTTDNSKIQPLKIFLGRTDFAFKIGKEIAFTAKPKLQTEFEKLIVVDTIRPNYFALYSELSDKKDEKGLEKLSELFENLKKTDLNIAYLYLKNNPQSPLSAYAFDRFAVFQNDYALLDKDFSELPEWIKKLPVGKYVSDKIEGAKAVAVGSSAPKFSQTDSDGKIVNLEQFKGKYVLVDFWASWCKPCRQEHPNFLRIYQKYNSKNFEILSVSIDEDKSAWLGASKMDGITWKNILDAKGQPNEIAVKYGVQAVPANFLVNSEGIIVAKNLKSDELEKTLAELIK